MNILSFSITFELEKNKYKIVKINKRPMEARSPETRMIKNEIKKMI